MFGAEHEIAESVLFIVLSFFLFTRGGGGGGVTFHTY